MSVPYRGERYTFTQPDGTQLEVRGWGDQHHAVFETLDGFTVMEDPHTGFYCYAELSPDGKHYRSTGVRPGYRAPEDLRLSPRVRLPTDAVRAAARGLTRNFPGKRRWQQRLEARQLALRGTVAARRPLAAPPAHETVGEFVGLCLLIDFPDVPHSISRGEVFAFCNEESYSGFGNNGSVMDFFRDNSEGKLTYTNLVTDYYTAQHPRAYYTDPSVPQPVRTWELITEALEYFKSIGLDLSQLSTDSGGYIYALNVFYAGRRVNNWGQGLWPHSYRLEGPMSLGPGRLAFDYQITNMGDELTLSTFCHENGHMICDFPDLYDYGYESSGVGAYCLMCGAGPYRKNPTEVCAYLKYKAGWATEVTPLTAGLEADAPTEGNRFFVHAKNLTEYFIVENRFRAGRDAGLPGSGLAIWHVDELGSNDDEQGTPSKHYECSLKQADDRRDLETGVNQGDSTDLFSAETQANFGDSTSPSSRWWDGTPSGLDIEGIGAPGETLSFRVGGAEASRFHDVSAPEMEIPDAHPAGLIDAITFDESEGAVVESLSVTVDITHTYRGDLRVSLTAPSGTNVLLHNRKGGSRDNLRQTFDFSNTEPLKALAQEPVEGSWTLRAEDLAPRDKGILKRWELDIRGRGPATSDAIVTLTESPGADIPDNDPEGTMRTLSTEAQGRVKEIAVSVDITHSFVRDLVVALISPTGTRVDLHHRMGGASDNIIADFDDQSIPDLARLIGESIAGDWKLFVSDNEARDTGKINHWKLRIFRE